MLRRSANLALVAIFGVGACTTDFFLEAGAETTTNAASSDGSPTTATSLTTSSAEGSSSASNTTDEPGTTAQQTSSGAESEGGTEATESASTRGTSDGGETTSPTGDPTTVAEASAEEASASTGAGSEGGGEGGALDCPGVDGGQEGCEASPPCDWYGDGPCFADVCHPDIEIACNGFTFEVCNQIPVCMWFGVPKEGECGLVPCGELEMAACMEAPSCQWVAEEPGACVFVECPACFEVGEVDCMGNEACTWLDVQESCVPD